MPSPLISRLLWLPLFLTTPFVLTSDDPAGEFVNTFKNNVLNAVAAGALSEYDTAASGRIDNYSKYQLRLMKCQSVRGGMTNPWPLWIRPDDSKQLSGYGANSNCEAAFLTKIFGESRKLNQKCDYALINDQDVKAVLEFNFEISSKTEDTNIKVSICNVKKDASSCEPLDSKTKKLDKYDFKPVRLCGNVAKNYEDVCLDALITNGDKVELYYHVYPYYYKNLSDKWKKLYTDVNEWCTFLKVAGFFGAIMGPVEEAKFKDCLSKG